MPVSAPSQNKYSAIIASLPTLSAFVQSGRDMTASAYCALIGTALWDEQDMAEKTLRVYEGDYYLEYGDAGQMCLLIGHAEWSTGGQVTQRDLETRLWKFMLSNVLAGTSFDVGEGKDEDAAIAHLLAVFRESLREGWQ